MIRNVGVLMDQFNMDQFNDTPLSPLDERPACPTCGGVLASLLTVSSDSFPQMRFFFEFSLFHCAADGLFYRTRSSTEGAEQRPRRPRSLQTTADVE